MQSINQSFIRSITPVLRATTNQSLQLFQSTSPLYSSKRKKSSKSKDEEKKSDATSSLKSNASTASLSSSSSNLAAQGSSNDHSEIQNWQPFNGHDSLMLELKFRFDRNLRLDVSTDIEHKLEQDITVLDGYYIAKMDAMIVHPIYWKGGSSILSTLVLLDASDFTLDALGKG